MNEHKEWLLPTLAGVALATLRRFRRKIREHWFVTVVRFLAHVGTCMASGYITWGLLLYFDTPKLIPPLCAVAGMYGTIIVDWAETSGTGLLTEYVRSKTQRRRPPYEPYNPYNEQKSRYDKEADK